MLPFMFTYKSSFLSLCPERKMFDENYKTRNPFLPNVLFWSPWKYQKSKGFLMFSGGSKVNIGKKRLGIRNNFHILQPQLFNFFKFAFPFLGLLVKKYQMVTTKSNHCKSSHISTQKNHGQSLKTFLPFWGLRIP